MNPQILIFVRGGVAYAVCADAPIVVHLVDWDGADHGEITSRSVENMTALSKEEFDREISEVDKEIEEANKELE